MNLPNTLTVARIGMIPFFIYFLLRGERMYSLGVLCLAGLTDLLDGYLARTQGRVTRLGSILDPVADKLLVISAFLILPTLGPSDRPREFPMWVSVVVIAENLVIFVGWFTLNALGYELVVTPRPLGKVNNWLQVLVVIAHLAGFMFARLLTYIIVVTTLVSGIDYAVVGLRSLDRDRREKKRDRQRVNRLSETSHR